jgi:hypothetical protein
VQILDPGEKEVETDRRYEGFDPPYGKGCLWQRAVDRRFGEVVQGVERARPGRRGYVPHGRAFDQPTGTIAVA